MNNDSFILIINAGSSSIKVSLYRSTSKEKDSEFETDISDTLLTEKIKKITDGKNIVAIGHRIVHGGDKYRDPTELNELVISDLNGIKDIDPEHLNSQLNFVHTLGNAFPNVKQVACFDTEFFKDLPKESKILPIPRRYYDQGIYRYGFHGLSYTFSLKQLEKIDPSSAGSKLIIAHLGSGSSISAIKNGKPIDTSMSFTPASGLVMSSRSGDIDPGLLLYLMKREDLSIEQALKMINYEAGLMGISESSADMKELLDNEDANQKSKDAVDIFCYQVQKYIGSYLAILGGLDCLIFSGGIGEKSAIIRSKICTSLSHLGIKLDESANQTNQDLISDESGPVKVRVINTDESNIIFEETLKFI